MQINMDYSSHEYELNIGNKKRIAVSDDFIYYSDVNDKHNLYKETTGGRIFLGCKLTIVLKRSVPNITQHHNIIGYKKCFVT